MAAADYESPYLDLIAFGSDSGGANTPPAAESNTDIAATLVAGLTGGTINEEREWLYIKAPYVTSGTGDPDDSLTKLVWLWEERVSLSNKPAVTLFGSGGYPNRPNADGTGILSTNALGGQTFLCRNDNGDLTWAMLNVSGEGVTIDRLYWRGAYDTSSFDRPQCCIEQTKASGIGTGALTVTNCTFDYFDEAIIIGRTGSTVCDRTVIDKCAFPDSTGTALVLNHSQAQGTLVRACKCECDVIVEANGVGQVRFEDMIYTEAEQVALKIMSNAQNTGTYIFDGYQKIDTQFTGGVLVETDTASSSRDALIIIRNLTDSRVLNSGSDTTEKVVKLYGNQVCLFDGCKGLAKIQVGGSTSITTGSSVNRPSLPTVIINNCGLKGPNAIADARALLVKSDGTQAVKGTDYEDLIVNPRFRLDPHGSEADNISFTALLPSIPSMPYAKDDVRGPRVWAWPRRPRTVRSPVIVQVHPSFDGTLAFDLKNILNHKAGIDGITSVTVSPSGPTITGPNGEADPAKDSSNTMVLFDIDGGQADDTDYTFTCEVTTTDSDSALVVTGVMQCRD